MNRPFNKWFSNNCQTTDKKVNLNLDLTPHKKLTENGSWLRMHNAELQTFRRKHRRKSWTQGEKEFKDTKSMIHVRKIIDVGLFQNLKTLMP